MRSLFIWLLSAITIAGSAQTTDTTRHSVVRLGKVVGKQLSWKTGANDQYYYFEFNDRGRGPSITSHSKTDNKGNILLQEISGLDYFKTKVEEKFEVKTGKAFWKNKFENESVPYKGELYSNMNGNPGELELRLRILKNSTSKKVNILPSGTLTYTIVKEEMVKMKRTTALLFN